MKYHVLENSLRNIYASYKYDGPGSILYAANLEKVDLAIFKAIILVAMEMSITKSNDYEIGIDAIEGIEKTENRDEIRQIFEDFNNTIMQK